ncbi:telomerase reverse transcriptase-like [Tubulanus polymorphus]|uniref:telomerase reverse transcriptase-like n=1 Tax=Tubulanus polymorphus TaxID=672921 RepID=UPI003DA3514E
MNRRKASHSEIRVQRGVVWGQRKSKMKRKVCHTRTTYIHNDAKSVIYQSYRCVVSLNECFNDVSFKDDDEGFNKFVEYMKTTLVATNEPKKVPSFADAYNESKPTKKLKSLICGLIYDLLLKKDSGDNVLTFAESKSSSSVISASSPADFLFTKPWRILHSRFGDEAVYNLISKFSIFVKDGENYFQISGKPIMQVVKKPVKEKRTTRKRKPASDVIQDSSVRPKKRRRKTVGNDHPVSACCSAIGFSHCLLIQHKGMYYCRDVREKFHPRHLMSKTDVSPAHLWNDISHTCVTVGDLGRKNKSIPAASDKALQILADFINNHKNQHRRWKYIINNYCPILSNDLSVGQLIEASSVHGKVFLFVRRILKRVVPPELWGSAQNRNIFFKNLQRLITMKHYQKFVLGDLMNNVKVSHMKWILKTTCLPTRECLAAKMYLWMLYYVFSVIKSYFYVTESEVRSSKKKAVFYRKPVWKIIKAQATKDQVENGDLQKVPKEMVSKILRERKALGICTMRFVPKSETTRMLLNLSKKLPGERLTINHQIKPLLLVLKSIVKKKPSLLGYTAVNFKEKFREFKATKWKSHEPLYFVKCDIKKCFNSIRLQKLLGILESILNEFSEEIFYTRKMSTVRIKNQRRMIRYIQAVQSLTDLSTFSKFVQEQNVKNSVVVDLVSGSHRNGKSFMNLARLHLLLNIINDGQEYYVMRRGISQGAVTSTMLANLYCGDMENRFLQLEDDELLARWVDDYIYISPHRDRTKMFLEKLQKGIPEYNLFINHGKTLTNVLQNEIPDVGMSENVKWCGVTIDLIKRRCR